jgi:cytochrome c biogenesis factor
VLGSYDPKTQLITILAYVNPLVVWIWIGGLVLAIGTAITVWPSALERREAVRVGALGAERA